MARSVSRQSPAAAPSTRASVLRARCHGQEGEGGIGPKLSDGAVVDAFPNEADEIRLVENGQAGMPAFKGRLSQAEIRDVVKYTRTGLK